MLKIKTFVAVSEDKEITALIEKVCDGIMLSLSDKGGHKVMFLSQEFANEIAEAIDQLGTGKPVM